MQDTRGNISVIWNIKASVVQNKYVLHVTDLDVLLSIDGELPKFCIIDEQCKMDHVDLSSRMV